MSIEQIIEGAVERVAGGKANVILDATVLSTLMACPRLTDFRFNHHLQQIGGRSNSLECGSIVHKFLEVFYKCVVQGLKRETAVQFAFAAAELYIKGCPICTDFHKTETQPKPECGHIANEYPGVVNTPKDSEGWKIGWSYVLDTCDQYQRFWISDHWVPLQVEYVERKVLYEDDEVRILWKAKLDLVCDTNQGIYPVDHKTMQKRRDTMSLNNQFIGQCLVKGTRGMHINKIGFQSSLKPEEKFTRNMVSYSAARLIEWQSETLPFHAKQLLMYEEIGHFPPNYTHCEGKYGKCPFHTVCESNPDMREEEIKLHFKVGPVWDPTNDED